MISLRSSCAERRICSIPRSRPVVHTLVARKLRDRARNSASRSPVTASARPYIGEVSIIRPSSSSSRFSTWRNGRLPVSSEPTSKARHVPRPMTGIGSPVDGTGRVIIAAADTWSVHPEFLEQRVADRVEVEPVLGDERARLDDNVVDVPDHLEALVEIRGVKAEPFAEDLHEIDDLEAAPVADIAKLAMTGMVDRGERRHAGVGDGGELARYKLALEGRQHRQGVGLGSDAGHVNLDKLDTGDDRQQLAYCRLHRRQNRPFVQSHAFLDA